jgi:mono/diheme cytochrome c family protein
MGLHRIALVLSTAAALVTASAASGAEPARLRAVVEQYCVSCHDGPATKGGLNLTPILDEEVGRNSSTWEKVVRRLRARQMPPDGKKRPDEETYASVVSQLEVALDRAAAANPNPGRTDTVRRLTRTEYQNAVRDLLGIHIDATALLPADESSHGFDNVTVTGLSPVLLDRYMTAAQKISRLAVGGSRRSTNIDTVRVKADITQEDRMDGLPVGTRGGALIRYTFPQAGEYEIQIRLARDRNEHVEGLRESHELEILLDRECVESFTVKPPADGKDYQNVDAHLKVRVSATAGPHDLGVTFVKQSSSLLETTRQPYDARFNLHRHPRTAPAVYQVSITGPFGAKGPGDTPSRRRIFVATPRTPDEEEACAKQILTTIMRRAYRRPVGDADFRRVLPLYREARRDGDFDAGIEAAVSGILVSREFLFKVERDPQGAGPKSAYHLSDLELASRLSFFLWSSIPDDELLDAAERGKLRKPDVLLAQTRRMLADPRAQSLVSNFAAQWLHLRNLDSITPDGRLFPDFDDNLRQAMRRETELLFEEVMRENRSVLDLLKSDHAFLNERLAKHYGIPHIYGPRFRKVALEPDSRRGGLLRHASVLTVTSYATRTSPVIRGKWVLENLLGTPPPPPLPNVPALADNTVSATLSVRERLSKHRANAACASCHNLIDPVGFALENFDAVGRWRATEEGKPVDSSGGLPDGSKFDGVSGLESALLRRPEVFVGSLTEKLLTFALGRGVETYDGPAVRKVVRDAKAADYRFSAIIEGIVTSTPFQMRMSP